MLKSSPPMVVCARAAADVTDDLHKACMWYSLFVPKPVIRLSTALAWQQPFTHTLHPAAARPNLLNMAYRSVFFWFLAAVS